MPHSETKQVSIAIDLPYVFRDIDVGEDDDAYEMAEAYIKEHAEDIVAEFKKSADNKLFFVHHLEGEDYDPYDEFNPAL